MRSNKIGMRGLQMVSPVPASRSPIATTIVLEVEGVPAEIVAAAHQVVAIPMAGINNSFPVTVAAGIAMAEWTRRYYSGGTVAPRD